MHLKNVDLKYFYPVEIFENMLYNIFVYLILRNAGVFIYDAFNGATADCKVLLFHRPYLFGVSDHFRSAQNIQHTPVKQPHYKAVSRYRIHKKR